MTQVVLLGYGGPESPDEIRPFLDRIVAGRPIPHERYESVVQHYLDIGGRSPFNDLTRRQARALQNVLHERGIDVPVRTAYRFTQPYIADIAREATDRREETIAVILAAHQSEASWSKYVELFPGARFTPPFFDKPPFIEAHAARVREALQALGRGDFSKTALIFTAHSIPQEMAGRSGYVQQLTQSATLVATAVDAAQWHVAYTSRSGSPREPWLEPDVRDLLQALARGGATEVVVDPIGFLCDHVEVLYDLDVDAAGVARAAGIRMSRARALNDHPAFIAALADAVQSCLA